MPTDAPKPLDPPFSKKWTLEERVRVCLAMLVLIQEDIYAGCYSVVGRPNITSIQHIFGESAETLEANREHIEEIVRMVEARGIRLGSGPKPS